MSVTKYDEIVGAIDQIVGRAGIKRERAITAWYASYFLGLDEDDAIQAADADGAEDGGVDFLYVDEEQETIYVLQGFVPQSPEKAATLDKWNALTAAISKIRNPEYFKFAGRRDIYEKLHDLDISSFQLVFGLITLGAKSEQITRAMPPSQLTHKDVSLFYEHINSLSEKYMVLKASQRFVPEDELDFVDNYSEIKGEFGEAIVGSVSAKELDRLFKQYRNQIFEGNVRLFIGSRKGGINEKIIETAQKRPGEFWALNNGITIVAESFQRKTDRKCLLRNFSIVNGCQTTVSLSRAIDGNSDALKARVLVRVVAAKKALSSDIVRYNNTQNPVKLVAVRSLDPIHEIYREEFKKIGYLYAPKQEGAKQAKGNKRIDLDKALQYLASTSESTILDAISKKSELFDRQYKNIFEKGLKSEKILLIWSIAFHVEEKRIEMLGEVEDRLLKIILGVVGTHWSIYTVYFIADAIGLNWGKLTLSKVSSPEFQNALKKYANRGVELYSEIASNIISGEEENPRNSIRVKSFLDKLKRQLDLKKQQIKKFALPALHQAGAK